MNTFQSMGLPEALLHKLDSMQFHEPTPIQAKAIPVALTGQDILGSAQTGTGKTAAFGIPLIAHLLANPGQAALVITPTRELAQQIITQLENMLGKRSQASLKTALLIGGESVFKQIKQLKSGARLIVGTPGRLNDHLERQTLSLDKTNFLVLDETDRMLDMGFTQQINIIIDALPRKRQTLLFSATLPPNIVRLAQKYLHKPVRINIPASSVLADKIEQSTLTVPEADKYDRLLAELENHAGSTVVFVKTKYGTERMAAKLHKAGHNVGAIHGDLRQNKRDRVIAAFRKKRYRILIATDVIARGLDVPHIELVINYDLPQCPEDYVHRVGRTARAGKKGCAVNFVTPKDRKKWQLIDRFLRTQQKQLTAAK